MTLTVVPLYENRVPLNDIPNQMRALADRIESGEVEAESVLCIIPVADDWPILYSWGEDLGEYGRIGVLETIKSWLAGRKVAR